MELPGPLVAADWLAAHLDDVRVIDVRWAINTGPKHDSYLAGHIPGAVFADLDTDLSDPPGPTGRHPLPSPEAFAVTRARLGMDRPVVAYDDTSGSVAARLWWMLDSIGIRAAVLDGGIAHWHGQLEAGEISAAIDDVLAAAPWPDDRYAQVHEILPAVAEGALLLDARSADRFAGQPNPIDSRPGHVPGSVSHPWTMNLDEAGLLRPAHELTALFDELGADRPLLSSCGSGVTGCHNLLAARIAGVPSGRLYPGSWSEWSHDPDRPVATLPLPHD